MTGIVAAGLPHEAQPRRQNKTGCEPHSTEIRLSCSRKYFIAFSGATTKAPLT
jgi:hypothetical protein